MIEKYLYSLNKLYSRKIENGLDYQNWKTEALNLIIKIYGENHHFEKELRNIKRIKTSTISLNGGNGMYNAPGSDNLKSCTKRGKDLIKVIIEDLEIYELPEKKSSTPSDQSQINLNVTQNNNNSQTVNLNIILNQLEKDLSPDQIKELQTILNSQADDKKQKMLNKLKSFGGDVCANIIAGILTNPAIFS
jgi:hypothetical protein